MFAARPRRQGTSVAPRTAEAAREKTERLILVRDRSERELADRLTQAGFPEPVVRAEVARAVAAGLVDDERFTRLYVAGKAHKGWGRCRIVREIKRFGIDLEQREGYPEAFFNADEELARARHCVAGFHSRAKDPRAACYRKLVGRGFSPGVAREALTALQVDGLR